MTLSDAEFLRSFRACELSSLSHEEHLRLAWIVLQEEPLLPAIETLRQGFTAFAHSKGKPELFHETITWAFIVLINERIERGFRGNGWREFVGLNPDLGRGVAVLENYYQNATLKSKLAARTFLLPDRGRIEVPFDFS